MAQVNRIEPIQKTEMGTGQDRRQKDRQEGSGSPTGPSFQEVLESMKSARKTIDYYRDIEHFR